jgi:hypothetical protein
MKIRWMGLGRNIAGADRAPDYPPRTQTAVFACVAVKATKPMSSS